jgi:hypothetical protein
MDLVDEEGSPVWMKLGPHGHKQTVRADWAFMCILKRLTMIGRIENVCEVVGGSRTCVSSTVNFMMRYIHHRYAKRIFNIKKWAPHLKM